MINGKDIPLGLSASALPDVSGSVDMFLQPVTIGVVSKQQVDGYTQEIINYVKTRAVRQPFSPRMLEVKPEGERSWRWETVHALPDLILNPDDIILWGDHRYRVMQKSDFAEYGYVLYEIIEDYDNRVQT